MPLRTFFLGTHEVRWLSQTDVPLFVSRRRLAGVKRLPRARGTWALDSGGFTELSLYGRWTITAAQYAAEVRRFACEIGNLQWASPMDYMTEPWIVAKTGLSVAEHQCRTLLNYLELRALAPDLPWIPVLQGWTVAEYLSHVQAHERAGIALASLPLVGVGSVCRRQGTAGVAHLLRLLSESGIALHCFGMKASGLRHSAGYVASADSLAWSYAARRGTALPECRGTHTRCNNCLRYALRWRARLLRGIDLEDACVPAAQPRLFRPSADTLGRV
jgi:hypothetical protein